EFNPVNTRKEIGLTSTQKRSTMPPAGERYAVNLTKNCHYHGETHSRHLSFCAYGLLRGSSGRRGRSPHPGNSVTPGSLFDGSEFSSPGAGGPLDEARLRRVRGKSRARGPVVRRALLFCGQEPSAGQ